MSSLITASETLKPSRPPWVLFACGILLLCGLGGILAYNAWHNEQSLKQTFKITQDSWEARVRDSSLPNYEENKRIFEEDKLFLSKMQEQHHAMMILFYLGLGGFALLGIAWLIMYRMSVISPLVKLEKSCHSILENGLKGHVYGRDRNDQVGGLARSIDAIRDHIVNMADMVVEGPGGTQRFHFSGKGGEAFNALINDLHGSLARLLEKGDNLEHLNIEKTAELQRLGEHIRTQTVGIDAAVDETRHSLSNAISATRDQLTKLENDWMDRFNSLGSRHSDMQSQAQGLITKFEQDMQSVRQIAGLTGQRVSQMLQNLGATDHDYKKAAKLSLEVSETFSKQATELSEKLTAATSLMRASGKIMSESTENSRARLMEAVTSVAKHDEALRAFLDDTAQKTDRVSTLFDDMKLSATRIADVVLAFDSRLSDFEGRSQVAFQRIEAGGDTVERVAGQLKTTHSTLLGSADSMRGQSETFADVVQKIRFEYSGFVEGWRQSFAETTLVIEGLKSASNMLQHQITEEWGSYTKQSRQLLANLERDVQGMNTRTMQVTNDTEKLIGNLSTQSQRLGDGANHFDLQVATLSQRLEDAAANVLRSNEHVVQLTASQVREVHSSVQDLVQRLGILSQLTGTLGAVAGQLGQIVPALTDARHLQHAGITTHAGNQVFSPDHSPEILARMETISQGFHSTIDGMRHEFGDVRTQISQWVDALTTGYKRMTSDIEQLDGKISERISDLISSVGQVTMPGMPMMMSSSQEGGANSELFLPALQLIQENLANNGATTQQMLGDMQNLQANVQAVGQYVQQTTQILHNMNSIFAEGFTRIESREGPAGGPAFDPARMEQASLMLEKMIRAMQAQSFSLAEKLEQVTQSLAETTTQLQSKLKDQGEQQAG